MFYEPRDGHGLPHNPFNAVVSPRPIAWVSTRGTDGSDNLAPYSFFNAVAYTPPQVMVATASGKPDRAKGKDTCANILDTGVFCVNVVEYAMRDAMNLTSGQFPREVDEFELAGVDRIECTMIPCARVLGAPASLECRLVRSVDLAGASNIVVFGEVVGVHLRDDCLVDGRFDVRRFQPLTRLGYRDYSRIADVFELARPDDTKA